MKVKSLVLTFAAVALISNPCFADPVDSLVKITKWEYKDGGNEHTYAVLKMTLNWTEANAVVPTLIRDGKPGYLATIISHQENSFIGNSIIFGLNDQPSVLDQYYLGGIYVDETWVWQPDEPVVYYNWNEGEPNNVGIETVLAIWGFHQPEGNAIAGKWNNTLPDTSFNPYAIQWSVVEWNEPDTTKSFIEPGRLFSVIAHTIDTFYISMFLGNFEGNRVSANVVLGSLLINGSITPASATIIPSHARFNDDAIVLTFPAAEFLSGYGLLWNTTTQTFTVSGMFDDNTPFSNAAEFTVVGHISGDVNLDGSVSVTDLTFLIDYIFRDGPRPRLPETIDVTSPCDLIDVADLIYFVDYFFRGGPPLVPGCTEE